MKITNKYNLPEVFVNVASKKHKGSGSYNSSGLSKSVRQLHLERRHEDEIELDVSDSLWAILGSAVHSVLEKGQEDTALTEQYLKMEIEGLPFVGMADHYKDGVISDYKFTSVWSYVFIEGNMDAYELQLNAYRLLYEHAGFPVNKLQIVYIFKDWNKNKVFDYGYPNSPIKVVDIKMLPYAYEVIKSRLLNFEKYKDTPDDELPECTLEERWAKASTWAIMKEGRKTAVRVFNSISEAETFYTANELDSKHTIEERRGQQFTRCEYCGGKEFCSQYRKGHESESN